MNCEPNIVINSNNKRIMLTPVAKNDLIRNRLDKDIQYFSTNDCLKLIEHMANCNTLKNEPLTYDSYEIETMFMDFIKSN